MTPTVGTKRGRLAVLARVANSASGRAYWRCACACGAVVIKSTRSLNTDGTPSCGCHQKEELKKRNTKHGHTSRAGHSAIYIVWKSMIARCTNPKHKSYADYGGRGITVCARWRHDFTAFLADVGDRPAGLTFDRIDNDGDYEPGNVRWATWSQQRRNQRSRGKRTA